MPVADGLILAAPAAKTGIYRAGLGRRVPPGHIRIGPAITIPAVLRALAVEPEPICRQAGLPPEIFDHPDNTLPMVQLGRLAARCEEVTGRGDFGLLVADGTTASNLGMVGFLLKQAPDVRSALTDLTRYLHHTDRAAVPSFEVAGARVTVGYHVIEPNVPAVDIIHDGAIAIYGNILKGLCGPHWQPLELTLARRRPAAAARYERHFGAPVTFDAEATTIIFDAKWLDTPLPHADAALRRLLQEQIDLLEAEEAGRFAEQVRRLLRTVLLTRAGSVDDIADLLRVTRRTLTRRLDAEGTSFRQLSDEIQFEIARQLIEHTAMSMTQIALALKYSETSAFSRAFRQWAGMPPRDWRARHQGRPGDARPTGALPREAEAGARRDEATRTQALE